MGGYIVKVPSMQLPNIIISVVKDWSNDFKFVAPYQENAADFDKGYATVFQINSVPQTTIGESVSNDFLELYQINAILVQFSFYKFVNYADNNVSSWDAAVYLRNMLGSYEALKKFNDVGLNIGPQISDIMLDTYRDNDRNKYVQHAHFEVKFYKKDSTIIDGAIFDNINIKNKITGG